MLTFSIDLLLQTEFVLVPFFFERMVVLGILVCVDSFLFVVSMLPIRAALALWHLLKRRPLHGVMRWDLQRFALLIIALLTSTLIKPGDLAHFVRKVRN